MGTAGGRGVAAHQLVPTAAVVRNAGQNYDSGTLCGPPGLDVGWPLTQWKGVTRLSRYESFYIPGTSTINGTYKRITSTLLILYSQDIHTCSTVYI